MTLQRDPDDTRDYRARIKSAWRATRRREGLATILAVVGISALIIVGLSYVFELPPATGVDPATPPVTYRAN